MKQRICYKTFLKEILRLSLTCIGGPQIHQVHYYKTFVDKKKYLSQADLTELYALCQIVPGPTSTQVLTSIGYKLGGPNLAYLTLFVWVFPSMLIMTMVAMFIIHSEQHFSLNFTRFIQPIAVGFVSYAAYSISIKTIYSYKGFFIMGMSAIAAYVVSTPFVFPAILLIAGMITAFDYRRHPKEKKKIFKVPWANFFLWAGVLIAAAILGAITKSLPIRLFENFYRNGSIIFGGGQVLTPMLYTEFVQYAPKQYLTSEEFLSGYALTQAMPGPTFSFSAYIGALSMRGQGILAEFFGAFMSTAGLFLPGTFLIFFVMPIWDSLKKFRPVRASLEGINAANAGLVTVAVILLFQPLDANPLNFSLMIGTFCLLTFSHLPSWILIVLGLVLGIIFS